jgi:hypothetical protein
VKPIITSSMLRKREPEAVSDLPVASVEKETPSAAPKSHAEPTADHPSFRAPQLGIRITRS